jgi:inosine/xanthosine triphosphatase
MKTIVIASKNPVKIQATLNGFQRMFPSEIYQVEMVSVTSGVGDQPASNQETLQGALNRANGAAELAPGADYWVGIEGGIEDYGTEMAAFAWIVVQSQDLCGKGRTGSFFLPGEVSDLVRAGKELGEADDIVFQKSNSKQKDGAIGILTGNVVDRTSLYEQAVILALVPFKNPALYNALQSELKNGISPGEWPDTDTLKENPQGQTYSISSDPNRLQIEIIHDFLAKHAYWSIGIPRSVVERAIKNSLCFGVFHGSRQVGFARVVTDRATFAYLADVFILEEHRGRGLSKQLLETILQHPDLKGLRRWSLATRDAHDLYARFGFQSLAAPERWMEIRQPDPYKKDR